DVLVVCPAPLAVEPVDKFAQARQKLDVAGDGLQEGREAVRVDRFVVKPAGTALLGRPCRVKEPACDLGDTTHPGAHRRASPQPNSDPHPADRRRQPSFAPSAAPPRLRRMTVTAVLSAGTYLGLTTDGWIAVGTLLLVLVTALGVWSSLIAERRRTQPIVIAHAVGQARFAAQGDGVVLDVHLTNEGGGTAFNVRFGVEYAGVRFPWKHAASDPDSGSRQRIVKAGEREPAE